MAKLFGQELFGDPQHQQGNLIRNHLKDNPYVQNGMCFAMSLDWLITCMDNCGGDLSPVSAWTQHIAQTPNFPQTVATKFVTYLSYLNETHVGLTRELINTEDDVKKLLADYFPKYAIQSADTHTRIHWLNSWQETHDFMFIGQLYLSTQN